MIKWLNALFSKTKAENNTDCIKPEVHEHQKKQYKKRE